MAVRAGSGGHQIKWATALSSAPASEGNHDSISTAFDGDLSRSHSQVGHQITGAATLGQPTTGYEYTPEAYPFYTYLYNSSGHNNGTATNAGRTAAVAYRTKVYQAGQGDTVAYNASAFVTGTKTGSTNFLANPAASLFSGDITAGAAGVYLNPFETSANDGGFDCGYVGSVLNATRTVATGAKSAVWLGVRMQSNGSAACDAAVSATGKWTTGIDFAMSTTDFGTDKAAVSLKAGQRVYFNNTAGASGNLNADWRSTVFNGDYIDYDSGTSSLRLVTSGHVSFGTHSANADAAISGYITIKDSGGTARKLAVIT